ncbi:class I SAM-dependent methyltransferase [Leptospira langatensis]|uniref:Class I SAM-dependent methyltransferase n=1 Tax=Leptospira langatensis TaxID=2484983 RepID=A0A5F1ZPA1_9LEPT|nr:class I SAM-dependent methyltransferase [Leptospira langatensis]TGK05557.1 class I SAM-dependent methyltransferase [Leptospira langatensis]TGL38689.1 class I SAM-dependent methyltransferase [Leptospira langatensis]
MDRNTRNQGNKSRIISQIPKKRPYSAFAAVYDRVMRQAPYSDWASMILEGYQIGTGNFPPRSIFDMGCGTCKIWAFLPLESELWGIDDSHEMLQIADSKLIRGNRIQGSLLSFPPLPQTFDLVFSVHDTLNYFLQEEEIARIFAQTSAILSENGIFFFDVSTDRNFQKNFQGKTLKETHGDTKLVWENEYDPKSSILKTSLQFTSPEISGVEEHFHRAYPLEVWQSLLKEGGFEILGIGSDYSSWKVSSRANYWNFLCKKNSK